MCKGDNFLKIQVQHFILNENSSPHSHAVSFSLNDPGFQPAQMGLPMKKF